MTSTNANSSNIHEEDFATVQSATIKSLAQDMGFFTCGIAKAAPVDEAIAQKYRRWLENGEEASMAYMSNYLEKRLDPRLLVPGVRSIISLALNYAPAQQIPEGEYQIAAYALGQDYHDLMKQKMRELAIKITERWQLPSKENGEEPSIRCFCDTAQLIIPHAGSMFFLGEIFLPYEADVYDEPMSNRCGNCHRCIDACPTQAIIPNEDFHAERCLSYQLIENRGELSDEAKNNMGNTIYGCDRCQTACPWNRFATPNTEPALQPKPELLSMSKEKWHNLTVEDYQRLFKGSAVKRVKYDGLKRNITVTKM